MKILVVSPHPDDETLGCGGTLLKHKEILDKVFWLNITNISVKEGWDKNKVLNREKEIVKVKKKYNFDEAFDLKYPSTKIDTIPISDLIRKITNIYKIIKPNVIYTPFDNDIHTDHQMISKALKSTFKWFRHSYIKKVLMYETVSETDFNFDQNSNFNPNIFMDISKFLDRKINIMNIYKDEINNFPFPRSEKNIRSLAYLRGSQSGYEAAEAFQLVFERVA